MHRAFLPQSNIYLIENKWHSVGLGRSGLWFMLLLWPMGTGITLRDAQGDGGGITGRVIDPARAVVTRAIVKARSLDTAYTRETVTSADGSFLFSLLEAGQYRVEVTAQGFETLVREPITVRVTEIADLLQLSLTIGAESQNVTVNGDAALLQTTTATLGKVFDDRMIDGLPLVTRNFTQLLALQPGVVTDIPNAADLGNGTGGFSVGGSRYYDNSVMINGYPTTKSRRLP
jgi:carboxypeptidase family protein